MHKVIDSLYGGNLGCDSSSNIFDIDSCLAQIEQQLQDWQRNLPSVLSLVQASDLRAWSDQEVTNVHRFRVILTLRYHNLRILAHRSVLVKFLDLLASRTSDYQQLSLLQQVGMNNVKRCIHSANSIIAIVGHIVNPHTSLRHLLGAWWFSLYYSE